MLGIWRGEGAMIAEAGAAIGSIKVAMDLAKGIAALKSETDINQAIIEIQRSLLDAQSAALSDKEMIAELRVTVRALQAEVAQKEDWQAVAARYVLTKTEVGTYTYDLRSDAASDEVFHRICPACFGNEKRSILQGNSVVECPVCTLKVRTMRPPRITTSRF